MKGPYSSNLPPKIFAEAVVHSTSGESLLRSPKLINSENVFLFHASPDRRLVAAERFREAGFEVLDIGKSSINIAAAPEVYERALGANLEVIERPVVKDLGRRGMADFINSADQTPLGEIDISQTPWDDILDGVAINEPAYFLRKESPSATPPQTQTQYLQVPNDLAVELGAAQAHKQGITGKGIKVVVVDSGCYIEHPFFELHDYHLKVVPGPGACNPAVDLSGHGTGVVANVLAVAPEVDLTVLKSDIALENKSRNVNSAAAFRKAVSLKPDIISCSWGSDLHSPYELSSFHKVLAAAISDAVRQGIVVVFASGNGQWGFPAQHPDVIAVGGVFKHLEGSLKGRVEASNYASSFISAIYPGRRVPDVCGLVGRLPNAAYIMLPVPPSSEVDRGYSVIDDETEATDGWAAFSGTSSAAPQLAGACALLEQFVPGLGPLKTKQILQETAIDILEGSSNPATGSGQARAGPDLATGYGLAVAHKAVQAAKAQNNYQHKQSTNFDRLSNSAALNSNNNFHQNSVTSYEFNYREETIMSSLDESTLRKLRLKIDEIQIALNSHFKEKYPDLAAENIAFVIHEENFIERVPESEAVSSLLNTLRTVLSKDDEGKEKIDRDRIGEKHISAAESLLKQHKCVPFAKDVLVEAISLKGKGHKYTVESNGEVFEILQEHYSKLKIISSGDLFIISDSATGVKGKNSRGKLEAMTVSKLKNKILVIEIIDRDKISNSATKALGNLTMGDFFANPEYLFDCDGDCCTTSGNQWWNKQTGKLYDSKVSCQNAS